MSKRFQRAEGISAQIMQKRYGTFKLESFCPMTRAQALKQNQGFYFDCRGVGSLSAKICLAVNRTRLKETAPSQLVANDLK